MTWSGTGLLLSAGALGGAAGTSLLAAPVLPRLGALAVTIYACSLAGILLLAAGAVASSAGGPPILRTPTASQLAALSYLAVAVTAVVFLAWYAAMQRLGVDRAGLFNGLIPIASLAAVALVGTGTITPLQFLAALTVLAGVIIGLGPTPQSPAGTMNQAGQRSQPSAETTAAMSDRSPSFSSRVAAGSHPSTWWGLRAPTIAPVTPGTASVQATATAAGVTPCRSATRAQRFGQGQVGRQGRIGEVGWPARQSPGSR
jgi:EamA-like transporter family